MSKKNKKSDDENFMEDIESTINLLGPYVNDVLNSYYRIKSDETLFSIVTTLFLGNVISLKTTGEKKRLAEQIKKNLLKIIEDDIKKREKEISESNNDIDVEYKVVTIKKKSKLESEQVNNKN